MTASKDCFKVVTWKMYSITTSKYIGIFSLTSFQILLYLFKKSISWSVVANILCTLYTAHDPKRPCSFDFYPLKGITLNASGNEQSSPMSKRFIFLPLNWSWSTKEMKVTNPIFHFLMLWERKKKIDSIKIFYGKFFILHFIKSQKNEGRLNPRHINFLKTF